MPGWRPAFSGKSSPEQPLPSKDPMPSRSLQLWKALLPLPSLCYPKGETKFVTLCRRHVLGVKA